MHGTLRVKNLIFQLLFLSFDLYLRSLEKISIAGIVLSTLSSYSFYREWVSKFLLLTMGKASLKFLSFASTFENMYLPT